MKKEIIHTPTVDQIILDKEGLVSLYPLFPTIAECLWDMIGDYLRGEGPHILGPTFDSWAAQGYVRIEGVLPINGRSSPELVSIRVSYMVPSKLFLKTLFREFTVGMVDGALDAMEGEVESMDN